MHNLITADGMKLSIPFAYRVGRRFSPTRFICREEAILVSISIAVRQINAIRFSVK